MEQKQQRKVRGAERSIIRKPEVRRRTGYSDTTIWRKENAGEFPRRVQLSADGMAVGWYLDEVELWIQSRIRERGKRPPAKRARAEKIPPNPMNSADFGKMGGA